MKISIRFFSVLVGVMLSVSGAFALDLQEARTQGLVGEKLDGYVAAVKPSAEVDSLIKDINGRRQQEYQRISKENGKAVDIVAKLASGTIIEKLPAGSLYQSTDGSWKKK